MKQETHVAYEELGLEFRLGQTIEYRRRSAEKYPHDIRNAKAIDLLGALYGQKPSPLALKSLNDAIVDYETACEGIEFDADTPPFEPKVSASLSSIGFGWHPKNIDEVLSMLTTDARVATTEVMATLPA